MIVPIVAVNGKTYRGQALIYGTALPWYYDNQFPVPTLQGAPGRFGFVEDPRDNPTVIGFKDNWQEIFREMSAEMFVQYRLDAGSWQTLGKISWSFWAIAKCEENLPESPVTFSDGDADGPSNWQPSTDIPVTSPPSPTNFVPYEGEEAPACD